ncbi:hypothetical protein PENTCL1PPCAC_21815, partial [Pristionchus entomophagus]
MDGLEQGETLLRLRVDDSMLLVYHRIELLRDEISLTGFFEREFSRGEVKRLDEGENLASLLVQNSLHLVELGLGLRRFLEGLHLVLVLGDLGTVGQVQKLVEVIGTFFASHVSDQVAHVDVGHLQRSKINQKSSFTSLCSLSSHPISHRLSSSLLLLSPSSLLLLRTSPSVIILLLLSPSLFLLPSSSLPLLILSSPSILILLSASVLILLRSSSPLLLLVSLPLSPSRIGIGIGLSLGLGGLPLPPQSIGLLEGLQSGCLEGASLRLLLGLPSVFLLLQWPNHST